jgi:hypothetical protein
MRKILNDIGLESENLPWEMLANDKRQKLWKKERAEYGFDERDTWSLNYTLALLIYERLKFYRLYAPVEMDAKNAHEYVFLGSEVKLGTAIDRVLSGFEAYIKHDKFGPEYEEIYAEYIQCWALLGVIQPSLWW